MLLADTQVYHLYRMHLDMGVMNLLLGGAAGATFIFPVAMYAQAFGIVCGVAGILAGAGAILWRMTQRPSVVPRRVASVLIAFFVVCVLGFHGVHIWADAYGARPLTIETHKLPMRYAATARRFMRSIGLDPPPRVISAASFDHNGALTYPLQPLKCVPAQQRPNIVLIAVDSWRFDSWSEKITPNVAQFARKASVFQQHYSGGNATRVGIFSLFYSIPGTYWHRVLDENRGPVVIHELLNQHYAVNVFRSAPIYSPEFDRTVFAEVPGVRRRSDGEDPTQWDRDLTDDFKAFLNTRDPQVPFFSFLFYDSPHNFHLPPDYPLVFTPITRELNYLRLSADTDPQPVKNRYLNSVHYVDGLIGETLAAIEVAGLMQNTVIIITSDHGQEMNDSGANYWGHNGNFSRFQTGVPMMWYEPGRAPATYAHRTSHFDVMPTLLQESLGCEVAFDQISVGSSLFDATPREVMVMSDYNDFAIVQPDQIAAIERSGVSIFDSQYRSLPDATLAPKAISQALEQNRRFYKTVRAR